MSQLIGKLMKPKSILLKLGTVFNLQNLGANQYEIILTKPTFNPDLKTINKWEGTLFGYEQDYEGYARQTLSGITRNDNIQDGHLWTANGVTFPGLNANLRYAVVIRKDTKDILSIIDFQQVYAFGGDITFNFPVYGILSLKVGSIA